MNKIAIKAICAGIPLIAALTLIGLKLSANDHAMDSEQANSHNHVTTDATTINHRHGNRFAANSQVATADVNGVIDYSFIGNDNGSLDNAMSIYLDDFVNNDHIVFSSQDDEEDITAGYGHHNDNSGHSNSGIDSGTKNARQSAVRSKPSGSSGFFPGGGGGWGDRSKQDKSASKNGAEKPSRENLSKASDNSNDDRKIDTPSSTDPDSKTPSGSNGNNRDHGKQDKSFAKNSSDHLPTSEQKQKDSKDNSAADDQKNEPEFFEASPEDLNKSPDNNDNLALVGAGRDPIPSDRQSPSDSSRTVPEPASTLLIGLGGILLLWVQHRGH